MWNDFKYEINKFLDRLAEYDNDINDTSKYSSNFALSIEESEEIIENTDCERYDDIVSITGDWSQDMFSISVGKFKLYIFPEIKEANINSLPVGFSEDIKNNNDIIKLLYLCYRNIDRCIYWQ